MADIFNEIKSEINFSFPNNTQFKEWENGLKVVCKNGEITVFYSKKMELVRSALIVKANGTDIDYDIEEKSSFKDVGLMIDCSRNAVRNVETVKKLIRNLALIGYNVLMLYTEDTYEVEDEPLFGYLRGRYTVAEMKELDAYANEMGVELIPCIQTLAHLNQIKRYSVKEFKCFDCGDILLVGEERTYQLIENMFKTLTKCFTTRRIHVGMDEAWLLGRGMYLVKNGFESQYDVMLKHIKKVCALAEKYGLKPIMWSDIFCDSVKVDGLSDEEKEKVYREKFSKVPESLSLCAWSYHGLTPDFFDDKLKVHSYFNNPVWFAGGTAQANRGFIPMLTYSMKIGKAAIECAKSHKINSLLETVWGDNGGECSCFSVLPAVMHYSYTARGIDEQRLKQEFLALTGYEFDEFMKIEYAQSLCGKHTNDIANPAKYGLYNDIFNGYLDAVLNEQDGENFVVASEENKKLICGEYGYLFETAHKLCEVLKVKYGLGIRLRKAYQGKDVEGLKKCVDDIDLTVKNLEQFIKAYRKQWLKENKPSGLEIQEIRLGGLKERLNGCKERLIDYLNGNVSKIDELEEQLLEKAVGRVRSDNRCDEFSYMAIASVNSFDGFTDIDV